MNLQLTHADEMALMVLKTAVRHRVHLGGRLASGLGEEHDETYQAWRVAMRHELDMTGVFCATLAESIRDTDEEGEEE